MDSKLVADFISGQVPLMQLTAKSPGATSRHVVKPPKRKEDFPEGEDSLEYIIAKKPSPKKVAKFLQGLIDEIAAENDL
jgi:hypothetical protein